MISRHNVLAMAMLMLGINACDSSTDPDDPASRWDKRFGADNAPTGIVTKIATTGDMVYVGGAFRSLKNRGDNQSRQNIAAWTGNDWSTLAAIVTPTNQFVDATVDAMEMCNGELYVSGSFESIDSVRVDGFAKWDRTAWQNAAAVKPTDLAVDGSTMYGATELGIVSIGYGQWSILEPGASMRVNRIVAIDSIVYGTVGADIFRWRYNTWRKIASFTRTDGGQP
ncbi:MAG: hypothetical protein H7X80_09525, partial [bacterium]|nr:hypothetical protein [Candidatus Kapabacteria bacterium]